MATNEFEQALKRLEDIVVELEKGERSLEESLRLFEEGIQMSRVCTEKLTAASERVQKLVLSEDGTFTIAPLHGEDL